MPDEHDFPHLKQAADRLGSRRDLDLADLRDLLCRDCAFWHEEHEDDLECSCFKMLHVILERGILTPEQLAVALGPEKSDPEE